MKSKDPHWKWKNYGGWRRFLSAAGAVGGDGQVLK